MKRMGLIYFAAAVIICKTPIVAQSEAVNKPSTKMVTCQRLSAEWKTLAEKQLDIANKQARVSVMNAEWQNGCLGVLPADVLQDRLVD